MLRETDFDFHAETRGASGYEGARYIRRYVEESADGFAYFLAIETDDKIEKAREKQAINRPTVVLQQEGIFRTK